MADNSGSRAGADSGTSRFAAVAGVTGDGCLSNGGNEAIPPEGGFNNTGCASSGLGIVFDLNESGGVGVPCNAGVAAGIGVTV